MISLAQLKQQQNAYEADKSSWQNKHKTVAAKLEQTLEQMNERPNKKFVQNFLVICYALPEYPYAHTSLPSAHDAQT